MTSVKIDLFCVRKVDYPKPALLMHTYRKDIDGMRAIAVVSVILFHLGFFPNGYLGVDIFFVISGYLITQIIYKECVKENFTIANFYLRRIRRILPLVLVVCLVAQLVAYFVMLPDDLENLAQSVIATNLFSNNILLLLTSKNYWDVVNEYKPLMHTWSLGVEEQFYVVFPLVFLFLQGKKAKYILGIIISMTLISLMMFLLQPNTEPKFYLIQYRFFELAIGGIGAILLLDRSIDARFKPILLSIIFAVLIFGSYISPDLRILIVTIASLGILVPSAESKFIKLVLENPVSVYLGKISFSLYMWHQLYLAFGRYFVFEHVSIPSAIIVGILIVITSAISYQFIEQPFRNKAKISTKAILVFTASMFILNVGFAFYLYKINGVVRDIPELGLAKDQQFTGNLNFAYNDRINGFNKPFTSVGKKKILIIGDSFARDWANVMLETSGAEAYEISYFYYANQTIDAQQRMDAADYVFLCNAYRAVDSVQFNQNPRRNFTGLIQTHKLDTAKVYVTGTKNFGANMGIYYNRRHQSNYCNQSANPDAYVYIVNERLKQVWGDRYIDLMEPLLLPTGQVRLFTDDCKFISPDMDHFTQFGAKFYAARMQEKISQIVR